MKLTIELIPATSFFSNVRSAVSKTDWEMISKACCEKAGNKCEICGGVSRGKGLDCHETWEFYGKTQKLMGLIALCSNCHMVKHFGLSEVRGLGAKAFKHLMKINEIGAEQAERHVFDCAYEWEKRSAIVWDLDLSWLLEKYPMVKLKGIVNK